MMINEKKKKKNNKKKPQHKKKHTKNQKPVRGFQKGFRGKTLCPTKKQRQRVAVATPGWALASRLSVETNGRNSMIATLLRRDDK